MGTVVVLLLLTPYAAAAPLDHVTGDVYFSQARLMGNTGVPGADVSALHLIDHDRVPLKVSWTGAASSLLVNWSRLSRTGAGESPTDPTESLATTGTEPSWGERQFSRAAVSGHVESTDANMMLVPHAAETEFNATGTDFAVEPSPGEIWRTGAASNSSTGVGNPHMQYVIHSYGVADGAPAVRTYAPMDATVRGDVTVYVWGSDVTVHEDGKRYTFRSGAWTSNETGPGQRGVVREEQWQFLRLELRNATLQVAYEQGVGQWTASTMAMTTNGTVSFLEADANLRSDQILYEAERTSFQVTGRVTQTLNAADVSPERLASEVEASDATITLTGNPIPAPADGGQSGLAWWLVVIGALTALGLAAVIVWRRRPIEIQEHVWRAHDALVEGRPRRARRLARRVLRARSDHEEAWFVWAASLLRDENQQRIVDRADDVPSRAQLFPPFAFVVGLAYFQLGRRDEAVERLAVACRDPTFRQRVAEGTEFAEARDDDRFRRLAKQHARDASAAYA